MTHVAKDAKAESLQGGKKIWLPQRDVLLSLEICENRGAEHTENTSAASMWQAAPIIRQVLKEIMPVFGPIGQDAFHHNDHFGVENANGHDPEASKKSQQSQIPTATTHLTSIVKTR